MSKTLVFVQASVGEGEAPIFPTCPLVKIKLPEGREVSTSQFVFERMRANLPGLEVKLLTNAPELRDAMGVENTLFHYGKGAGPALAVYVREHTEITTLVRVLGNHTLTDPQLVLQTLERFDQLPDEVRQTQKLGPTLCGKGQNIEVFSRQTLFARADADLPADQRAAFEEHVTAGIPSTAAWEPVTDETQRVAIHADPSFHPQIALFPGFVETKSRENIEAILSHVGLEPSFLQVRQAWKDLGLDLGGWQNKPGAWSDSTFVAQSFPQLREAVRAGMTTVKPLSVAGPEM